MTKIYYCDSIVSNIHGIVYAKNMPSMLEFFDDTERQMITDIKFGYVDEKFWNNNSSSKAVFTDKSIEIYHLTTKKPLMNRAEFSNVIEKLLDKYQGDYHQVIHWLNQPDAEFTKRLDLTEKEILDILAYD